MIQWRPIALSELEEILDHTNFFVLHYVQFFDGNHTVVLAFQEESLGDALSVVNKKESMYTTRAVSSFLFSMPEWTFPLHRIALDRLRKSTHARTFLSELLTKAITEFGPLYHPNKKE